MQAKYLFYSVILVYIFSAVENVALNLNPDSVADQRNYSDDGQLTDEGIWVYHPVLPAGIGNKNKRLSAFRIDTDSKTEMLTQLSFDLNGCTDIGDLSEISVWFNGSSERFDSELATLIGTAEPSPGAVEMNCQLALIEGENYIWITADVRDNATEGNQIGATPLSYTLNNEDETRIPLAEGSRTLLLTSTLLFSPGDGGSKSYRIPALVTAADGTLIAATDKRWNGSPDLPNHIDVLISRSSDMGKTWSEPMTIAGSNTTTGYGDPALVVNQLNGDIVCLFASHNGLAASTAENPIRINQSISHDNGLTWSIPEDLTPQIYGADCEHPVTKNWQAAFVTSGAASQLTDGRLMAVLAVREKAVFDITNFVMYSDDHGRSWQVSTNRASSQGDEAKVVELDNGHVLMSIRQPGYRWFNVSCDKGITWGSPFQMTDITDPFCNGDMIRYTSISKGHSKNRLLHSIPFDSTRTNVSVLMSYDEGASWPVRKTIYAGPSAYSALSILNDGTIGIYFEVGEYDVYQMYFMRFSLDWLSDSQDN